MQFILVNCGLVRVKVIKICCLYIIVFIIFVQRDGLICLNSNKLPYIQSYLFFFFTNTYSH